MCVSKSANAKARAHTPNFPTARALRSNIYAAAVGHRPSATGHRPPAIGHRPSATGHRPPAIGHRPSATGIERQYLDVVHLLRLHERLELAGRFELTKRALAERRHVDKAVRVADRHAAERLGKRGRANALCRVEQRVQADRRRIVNADLRLQT